MTVAARTEGIPTFPGRLGGIAVEMEEAFAVAAWLRAGGDPQTDEPSFRSNITHVIWAADERIRARGYSPTAAKLAVYAFVAFLDETVLGSRSGFFVAWRSKTLQEEVFGDHLAGVSFYQHLDQQLERPPSGELGDLLEVFHYCLLLGFEGKYAGAAAERARVIEAVRNKITECRDALPLSPNRGLPSEYERLPTVPSWQPQILSIFGGALLVAVLYVVFRVILGVDVNALRAAVGG